MKNIILNVDDGDELIRIDAYLAGNIEGRSRSYIQKLIKDENVLVNEKAVKPNYTVRLGDEIKVFIPDDVIPDIEAENIPLDIVYEDEDVIVVNKPKDMVVHPAAGHYSKTLVNALMFHCKDSLSGINGVLRPGIVHRIDKDTTGLLLVCKNDASHECIAAQLKEHSITRAYRAIVHGRLKDDEGTIDKPIGRSKTDRKKMAVCPDGRRAVTRYKVLERFDKYSYVECRLETGRTHQIRVHFSDMGHPLLGDELYSKQKSSFKLCGQCLHAATLGFIHPVSKKYIEFCANLPEYFSKLLEKLEK